MEPNIELETWRRRRFSEWLSTRMPALGSGQVGQGRGPQGRDVPHDTARPQSHGRVNHPLIAPTTGRPEGPLVSNGALMTHHCCHAEVRHGLLHERVLCLMQAHKLKTHLDSLAWRSHVLYSVVCIMVRNLKMSGR